MMPATTDIDHVLALLRRGRVRRRSRRTRRGLLPGANSPRAGRLAEYVAVAVREALLADPQPDAVVRYSERSPYDAVIEVCLAALEGAPTRRTPAQGPLAVARGWAARSRPANLTNHALA